VPETTTARRASPDSAQSPAPFSLLGYPYVNRGRPHFLPTDHSPQSRLARTRTSLPLAACAAPNAALTLLPPAPAPSAPGLVGIARLAAAAPKAGERNQIAYYRLPVRSLLNRVRSNRVAFLWSINPYRGCEFGCQYCYARYTHEYMELESGEFERKIYAKQDVRRLLLADLRPEKVLGEHIAIGAATDPYQPAERAFGVTREILETLLAWSLQLPQRGGLSLSITTKSELILRDADLLRELALRNALHVNFTVTTCKPRLARLLEPRAPAPALRLEAVSKLNDAGVPAGVFIAPILPGITDQPEDLEAVAAAATRADARYLCGDILRLMSCTRRRFFPFLEQKFPRLLKQYRRWYARSGYAPAEYRKHIARLLRHLRQKYHLPGSPPHTPSPHSQSASLACSPPGACAASAPYSCQQLVLPLSG